MLACSQNLGTLFLLSLLQYEYCLFPFFAKSSSLYTSIALGIVLGNCIFRTYLVLEHKKKKKKKETVKDPTNDLTLH